MKAAGVAAALFFAACRGGESDPPASVGERTSLGAPHAEAVDSTPEGRLYRRACIMCHGERGAGTQLGPPLAGIPADRVLLLVTAGIATPDSFPVPMPAGGDGTFTDAELRTVSSYVASFPAR